MRLLGLIKTDNASCRFSAIVCQLDNSCRAVLTDEVQETFSSDFAIRG